MKELRCYSNSKQEPTNEARIDELASLVVSLAVPDANPIPLRDCFGLEGCSLADSCSALYTRRIDMYAANGKTKETFGLAERVRFQLDGNKLQRNFVVIDNANGLEDFLLGRNFLRAYNFLVTHKKVKCGTMLGTAAPVRMVYQAVSQYAVPQGRKWRNLEVTKRFCQQCLF